MRDLVFYYKTKHERARFFTKTEISQQQLFNWRRCKLRSVT